MSKARRPLWTGFALGLMALALATAAWPSCSVVAARDVTDQDVEAAFIIHFTQLVEWPPGANTEGGIVVGVIGNEALAKALETMVGPSPPGSPPGPPPIRIVRARTYAALGTRPQVLFIGRAAAREPLLTRLRGEPVLTVGDAEGFAEAGGMIGFRVTDDGRVAFDINLERARGAGLKISSQVLKLARIVTSRP